jgi:hypothetical protein
MPINDMLNPKPSKFGLNWIAILGILSASLIIFLLPGCKIAGLLSAPVILGFAAWLVKDDPKEPMLILYDLSLPAEFDPGK